MVIANTYIPSLILLGLFWLVKNGFINRLIDIEYLEIIRGSINMIMMIVALPMSTKLATYHGGTSGYYPHKTAFIAIRQARIALLF